ncbi:hypothetical protein MMC15_002286 [Xylographa vitiligo]|nr:hypothetical protein [Xylographa vitiligo]
MTGIRSRPDLQFDLFDALGLNPTNSLVTVTSIRKGWRRVNLQIHPDKLATARYIPVFPTYTQAQKARDYLLAEDNGDAFPETRIQAALSTGRVGYRSTWNPWVTPNTEDVLKPIPGAPNVETHGPAPLGLDLRAPPQGLAERDEGGWTAERRERWWTAPAEGSTLPDWEGRRQWAKEEWRREQQAERDRELRREQREKRREMKERMENWGLARADIGGGKRKPGSLIVEGKSH